MKQSHVLCRDFRSVRGMFYLGGAAVERYRADFGLSTLSEGRGIFDWNVECADAVLFGADGGGVGAMGTDGEIARRIEPDRVPLGALELATMTGLVVFAVAVGLAKTLLRRGRVFTAGEADRNV